MFLDAGFSFSQIFIYLFLVVLGLRCCTDSTLVAERGATLQLQRVGFSSCGFFLWSTGSRVLRLQ